jgi:zinc transporter ZupT
LSRGLFRENGSLLGLANSFSAGIFLMLAFTQMIPHALDIFQTNQLDLSLAFKYSVVGYLLIMSIEKILFDPSLWTKSKPSTTHTSQANKIKETAITSDEGKVPVKNSNSGLILVLAMSIHRCVKGPSLFEHLLTHE